MDLPILCTLTSEQLRERRLKVLEPIRSLVIKTEGLDEGYAYTFQPHDELLIRLAQLVGLERQCCQFLTFKIIANHDSLRLEVTGPEGAKSTITDFFGDSC